METFEIVLRMLLVADAIALIVLILLQQGKGASMGAAFGSGASQTVFGSAGASSFLTKLTAWLAVAFFIITLMLAWTARERAEAMGQVGIPQISDEDVPTLDMPQQAPADDDVPFDFDAEDPPQGDVPSVGEDNP